MARRETVLSVFVASPDDVDEERNRLEDVMRQLNTTWSRTLGIRLELIKWETEAYPGFGEDPQAVINKQIPQDYDLFIGLMWYKFGTPTGRAESGTFEEFQQAKKRHEARPDDLQLMIYFKDAPAPIPPSELDTGQLARISSFRSSLGEQGGLYWTFKTPDEFEKLVTLHLSRHVQKYSGKAGTRQPLSESTGSKAISKSSVHDDDEDVGFLDLVDQFEDDMIILKEVLDRITSATREIGKKMKIRTTELTMFKKSPEAADRQAAKRLIAKAAADMDQFTHQLESELPLYSKHTNSGMDALTRAAALLIEFRPTDENVQQAKASVDAIRKLRTVMSAVEKQIAGFRDAITSVPRMTTTLNRSKRAMVSVIQQMIDELHSANAMAGEAEASFALVGDEN